MNYLLLIISVFSMIAHNGLSNSACKQKLKKVGDLHYFNMLMYLVCVVLFALMAIGKGISFYTAGMGILFGVVTMLAGFYKLLALSRGPMHITILITTSSMIIPALSGVVLFDEAFSAMKLVAIVALLFFIYLSSKTGGEQRISKKWFLYCALSFLFQGAIGVLQKVHQSSSHKDELFAFLVLSFLCSLTLSAWNARRGEREVKFGGGLYGMAFVCGICTFTMNFLNLRLSGVLPSQLFFPVVNGGALIFTSLCAVLIFKEKMSRRQMIGLIGGIAALIGVCVL